MTKEKIIKIVAFITMPIWIIPFFVTGFIIMVGGKFWDASSDVVDHFILKK